MRQGMSTRQPKSYDEITRRTVVDPDSSWRPIPSASEHPDDQALLERARDALLSLGFDDVGLEVEDGRITLLGWVRSRDTAARVERLVRNAAPEAEIRNRLHVPS
jgi:osmotically-inducible protein OsmY